VPTENEIKFVLDMNCERFVRKVAKVRYHIRQGYLFGSKGVTTRIREVVGRKRTRWYHTNKYATRDRVIEIEKKIDFRDFSDLWCQTMNKLEKVRYEVPDGDVVWEIDFFRDHHDHTYFAMAEVELPEGVAAPDVVPPFVREHLVYEVPLTDSRFSSKLLADVRHARALYHELTNK
jgi:CYTH domain-containing protein